MILITGGMGFIGMHTVRQLLDAGEDVVIGVHSSRREPDIFKDEIGKRVQIAQLDVTSGFGLIDTMQKYKVTRMAHLVAPRLGAMGPGEELRTNTAGLVNVLEGARLAGLERVAIASSVSVYSGIKEGPYREDITLPVGSLNSTEAYKKTFEILGSFYASQTGLDTVFMRIGNIYGPLYYSGFNLPSRLVKAAVTGQPPQYGPAGTPFSEDEGDWTYVKDVSKGIQLLVMADKLNHPVYNISSGKPTRLGNLADAVGKAVPGANFELQPGRSPNARISPYSDISRISADTGYEPQYSLEPAINEYAEWMKATPEWS